MIGKKDASLSKEKVRIRDGKRAFLTNELYVAASSFFVQIILVMGLVVKKNRINKPHPEYNLIVQLIEMGNTNINDEDKYYSPTFTSPTVATDSSLLSIF